MNEWRPEGEAPYLVAGAPAASTHTAEAHHDATHDHHASPWTFFGFSLVAFTLLALVAILGTRRMRVVPRGLQNFLEFVLDALYGITEMVMGPRGRQYAPLLATLFLYILVMNLSGLIPFLLPGTANLSITLGLALFAFVAVQYYGFRAHGWGYLKHFAGPVPWLAFLLIPLELIAEIMRPISLSVRLYGNVYGEEQVVEALATQFHPALAVLMLPLQVLFGVLQALVFTLLVTVYIGLATEPHAEQREHVAGEAVVPPSLPPSEHHPSNAGRGDAIRRQPAS